MACAFFIQSTLFNPAGLGEKFLDHSISIKVMCLTSVTQISLPNYSVNDRLHDRIGCHGASLITLV